MAIAVEEVDSGVGSRNEDPANLTFSLAGAPASGEVLVAVIWWNEGGVRVITPPSGWTSRGSGTAGSGGSLRKCQVWTKVAGASEPTSYDFVLSNTYTYAIGWLLVLSGAADPDSGFDTPVFSGSVSADPPYSSATNRLRCPAQTVGVADSLAIAAAMVYGGADVASTPPTGFTDQGEADSGGSFSMSIATKVVGSGSTGDLDYTAYGSGWTAYETLGLTLNVRPAAGGSPQTISPTSVASAASVPSPGLSLTVYPSAVSSPAAVQQPSLAFTLAPTNVASPAAVPSPALAFTLYPDALASPAAVPQPTLTTIVTVSPSPVASPAAVPQPTVVADQTISANPVASTATVYAPDLSTAGEEGTLAFALICAVPAEPTLALRPHLPPTLACSVPATPSLTLRPTP